MTTATRHQTVIAVVAATALELAAAWDRLHTAQRVLLAALHGIQRGRGTTQRVRAAIAAFNQALGVFNRDASAIAERWAAADLPAAYRDGAERLLAEARRDAAVFEWTSAHQEAVTSMTATFYAALVGRILEAIRRAQAFARAVLAGATAPQGLDEEALLADYPLGTVLYAPRTRYPAAAWARAALAWQAVWAANTGAINAARDLGVVRLLVDDGPECGWTSHDDPDHAAGSIRTVEDCATYPVAHPGCIRQFSPLPSGAS